MNKDDVVRQMNENIHENPIKRPAHYLEGEHDLFDEWYKRFYHSEELFTGREVFIIIMKAISERYTRRYPNKNKEDLSKGIYTLERLKAYEEDHFEI